MGAQCAELSSTITQESKEVLQLRQRNASLAKRVAAARADAHRLWRRDAELIAAHIEDQAEVLDARKHEDRARLVHQELEAQLVDLKRQASECTVMERPRAGRSPTPTRKTKPSQHR